MDSYTNLEKNAIIKLLIDMMQIDGDCHSNELQLLQRICNLFGISSSNLSSLMERDFALSIISDMDDDKKMQVTGLLQQMIFADGIKDNNEMFFFGQIVTQTGIDKAVERKNKGFVPQYDDARIYLDSSKIALDRRSPDELNVINEQAEFYKNFFSDGFLNDDDICNLLIENTISCVKYSGWDLYDIDGVTWFLANHIDAMVKAGVVDSYEDIFIKCFKMYFKK